MEYANGTNTTYTYDALTFRVRNIKTMRSSDVLQDLLYWYDPVGNITLQRDEAHQTLFYDNSIAEPENDYTYDALYRLIEATGREHEGNSTGPDVDSWADANRIHLAHTHDETKMRSYTQQYDYDAVGNMLEQRHICGTSTYNWTKEFTIDSASNRLASVATAFTETYGYDNRGNLISGMAHLSDLVYNESNRLEMAPNATGSITTYYQYDSAGQRVRKVTEDTNSGILHTRKYVGQWETYTKDQSGMVLERETLHISDDTGRIAIIDTPVRDDYNTSETQLQRFQLSNHLGTATLELDDSGNIISYEEYYPFGTTSFQSGRTTAEVSLKRYRFTGKERDEETGMYYHGARYYIPWLCRWSASDPINNEWYNAQQGQPDRNLKRDWIELTASSYEYCYANPVRFIDLTGEQATLKDNLPPLQQQTPSTEDNTRVFQHRVLQESGEKHPYSKGQYIVRKGDNLTTISKKLGVSIDDLASMNNIEDRNKLAIGQVLDVAPERNFSKNPRGGYQNPNNPVGVEYTVDNMFSVGAQFAYGLGSENMIIVAGKSLDALRNWEQVQKLVNEGTQKLWSDGKLTPGETFFKPYTSPNIPTWLHNQTDDKFADRKFFSPQHVIGSFNLSMRVNADGQTATVAVYNSITIASGTDNLLGRNANLENTSSNSRTPFSNQYVRFIWKVSLVK